MQNKNWYEYQPQIIAGVIGGIAFAAYRIFRGAAIGAAAGQGVFAGLLVFGVLCAISNAFNAQSQQDSQNLDRFIEEKKKEYIVYFANNFCTLYISKEDAMPLLRAINMGKEI